MKIYKKLFNVKVAGIKLQRNTKAYNYKYATLDQIQEKLNPLLEKEKLIILHFIKDSKLITEIRDIESDEVISSEIELKTEKPQDKGSEITYYRRYNLLSLLDLEVEDDDGAQAQKSNYQNNEVEKRWIEDKDIQNIEDLIKKGRKITIQDVRDRYKISRENLLKLNNILG